MRGAVRGRVQSRETTIPRQSDVSSLREEDSIGTYQMWEYRRFDDPLDEPDNEY